ncbi:ribose-phosphate diphosphokinase [Candidatus Fokinia crypta]|uniref:ribose-phosphate diphosphokinase n=1 Tax=Candidatus Fokinia crypta TaxID=1920990 RepID=A0ABZ0URU8_9RICK|nr:ribose-phosphate diphosphokinase [Candidatus Fokinia cryptica]WPX97878.1 Ribose-phosphate pyrophosphokinase [Candidatus Fokinia cryptica]
MTKLKIIAGTNSQKLAQKIALHQNAEYIQATVQRFPDGELSVQLHTQLYNSKAIIVHSIHQHVNDNVMELLLLANATQNVGASKIIAVTPYLAYCRQDKQDYQNQTIPSINAIAKIIKASGIECLLAIDIHSKSAKEAFDIEFHNINTTNLFASCSNDIDNPLLISPDSGGAKRCQEIAKLLHCEHIVMNKKRNIGTFLKQSDKMIISGRNCIIIDDIIDTGWTITNVANILMKYKAKTIRAMVTHAVLSQNTFFALHKTATMHEITTTSTITHMKLPKYFRVLDISTIISKKILEIINH